MHAYARLILDIARKDVRNAEKEKINNKADCF
jgi:hypothetical protein